MATETEHTIETPSERAQPSSSEGHYRCQSCDEIISRDLDDPKKRLKKCPHCGYRHSPEVKQAAGRAVVWFFLAIPASITIVGLPICLYLSWRKLKHTRQMLEDPEHRVGYEADH